MPALLKTRYLFSSPLMDFEEGPNLSPSKETLFMNAPKNYQEKPKIYLYIRWFPF